MTTQKLISDARRRARAESRETGRPYQTILDEIAQRAGRAGWSAFVLDPAEPVPELAEEEAPPQATFDPDGREWDQWILATGQSGRVPMVIGIVMVLAATLAPNYVRVDAPYFKEVCLGGMAFGIGLLFGSIWRPAYRTVLLASLSWSAPRPMGSRRMTMLALIMVTRISVFFLVPAAFTDLGPLLMMGVRADTIQAFESDGLSHRSIRISGMKRDTPVASYRARGNHADLSIVVVDTRLQPRPMRALFMGEDVGGRFISSAMMDSPVIRFVGKLDCSTGRFRASRVEAAASYDAPAGATRPIRLHARQGAPVEPDDVSRICHLEGRSL